MASASEAGKMGKNGEALPGRTTFCDWGVYRDRSEWFHERRHRIGSIGSVNVLAIETSNPTASARARGGVAFARWSENGWSALRRERLRPSARHDDALLPAIARVCERAGVGAREIDRIGVSLGPGGFTGVRIGVVTAKLIGAVSGAAVVGVPSTLVAALARRRCAPLGVALAGKRGTAWVARWDAPDLTTEGLPRAEAGRLMSVDDLDELHARAPITTLVCGAGTPESFLEWAQSAGVRTAPLWLSPLRVLEAAAALPPTPLEALRPLYPREPEAVRKWRERG